jgi:hypothetical protein
MLKHKLGTHVKSPNFEMSGQSTAKDAMDEGLRLIKVHGIIVANASQWEATVHQLWPMKE